MGRLRRALGIRLIDVAATIVVAAAVELDVTVATGPGQQPLNATAYVFGAVVTLPVLLRRRWPRGVLIACSLLLLSYYWVDRRNISPAPLLCLPLYDAAVAGFLALAIVIPAAYMTIGLFLVGFSTREPLATLVNDFLPSVVMLALAIMLGDAVRSRRALAAETADRLRLADEEREAEAGRRVAEERLRIARELHDTVAHSMATITVQAGSALHLLAEAEHTEAVATGGTGRGSGPLAPAAPGTSVRAALTAIRETSKDALTDMRATLGQLRGAEARGPEPAVAGLDRLDALTEAVRAAGAPVSVVVEGDLVRLAPAVDHAAYRILQESLTNVLRHAGPDARACVRLRYAPDTLTIEVADDGVGICPPDGSSGAADRSSGAADGGSGHGLTGMTERAGAVGGELLARPRPGGGFEVMARLPVRLAEVRS